MEGSYLDGYDTKAGRGATIVKGCWAYKEDTIAGKGYSEQERSLRGGHPMESKEDSLEEYS